MCKITDRKKLRLGLSGGWKGSKPPGLRKCPPPTAGGVTAQTSFHWFSYLQGRGVQGSSGKNPLATCSWSKGSPATVTLRKGPRHRTSELGVARSPARPCEPHPAVQRRGATPGIHGPRPGRGRRGGNRSQQRGGWGPCGREAGLRPPISPLTAQPHPGDSMCPPGNQLQVRTAPSTGQHREAGPPVRLLHQSLGISRIYPAEGVGRGRCWRRWAPRTEPPSPQHSSPEWVT